ncbi:HD domain-containing protein [candidate division TA06 bacterium]|uniref:HD domain-containing protein n=1 Tax=candidate division TA06 bacterium TaxID=2250710 RepID=A0A933I8T5_UNCT6|nr:HD domain-containing protein [candidate division TA06 bacterium]
MKRKPVHKKTDVAAIASLLVRLDKILAGSKAGLLPSIRKLAREVDQLVPYYDGHMMRVTFYSLSIGLKMGLSREELLTLEVAALLHDFGKLGVDEHTLEKEEELSDDEINEIHHHAERGFHILSGFAKLERAAAIIRDHHEKYDGSGYPAHKKGPDISLLARIIAVADAYDAMTADRPYHKGLSQKEAESELLHYAGKQFDPQVVDCFVNRIKDKKPKLRPKRSKGSVSSGQDQFADYLPVFYNYY